LDERAGKRHTHISATCDSNFHFEEFDCRAKIKRVWLHKYFFLSTIQVLFDCGKVVHLDLSY
jgi:hypothetical protein